MQIFIHTIKYKNTYLKINKFTDVGFERIGTIS
jgi:hypothetical protein